MKVLRLGRIFGLFWPATALSGARWRHLTASDGVIWQRTLTSHTTTVDFTHRDERKEINPEEVSLTLKWGARE